MFDVDPAYRISVAYTGVNNAGDRGLYFNYDHAGGDTPGFGRIFLATYNADLEFLNALKWATNWATNAQAKFTLLGVDANHDANAQLVRTFNQVSQPNRSRDRLSTDRRI